MTTTIWETETITGIGDYYDQLDLPYDALFDNLNGSIVYYDSVGTTTIWTTQPI